jgi:hypothetical protein
VGPACGFESPSAENPGSEGSLSMLVHGFIKKAQKTPADDLKLRATDEGMKA